MEIDGAVNPHLRADQPHALPESYESVYARLSRLPVDTPGYWKIEIPHTGGPITSRFYAPEEINARTRMVTLDPTTLRVMRDAFWNDTFFTWIYDLHMNLQLGPPGDIAMGIAALVMIVMLLSGLANWALPKGSVSSKLRFKRRTSSARRIYDIHKLVGLVSLVLVVLCVGTAAMISLPSVFHPMLDAFSSLKKEPSVTSAWSEGAERISIDDAIAVGLNYFPGSRVVWVRVPAGPHEPYDLQMRQPGDPMTRFPRTHLWLDQYTGRVLAVKDPHTEGFGDTVLNWLVPLHDGKAFGIAGRVLVMLLGPVIVILFVTGFIRWKQKRMGRARVAERNGRGSRARPARTDSSRANSHFVSSDCRCRASRGRSR